ncbi:MULTISPECIES: DUF885 family protein [Actinosynnema]|uniref:DUF885 domain-containing protein n=1 Tax=Actinosynnema TaxID=40566 RepID=UPI0020A48280|nr:DUF885 domain-containing protein [Actinosynnema pretiosum]MCP2096038.1 Uncharacterized conserved protein, DUF885 familyt [Actinosynnema pretiosum]
MATTAGLAEELLELVKDLDPIGASLYGLPVANAGLEDVSEAGEAGSRARALDIASRAEALPEDDDPVTRAVVVQQALAIVDRIDARLVEHSITDSFFAPAGMLLAMLPMLTPSDEAQQRAYVARLAAIPEYLGRVADRHRSGRSAGRRPVAHLVEAAVAHLDRYLSAERDPLARHELAGEVAAERDRVLAERVRPAFAAYREVLRELLPDARPADRPGLCWLPDGEAAYAALARHHTTTPRTPDELHETGLAIIADLEREYAELGGRVFGASDAAGVFERMRTDPALRWDTEEELLEAARTAISRAEEVAPKWFGRLPAQRCAVEAVPADDAPGAPTAYYSSPALDGSRPGTYYANTHRVQERFRYQAEAIAFHEAVPGHHFQISLAQELTDLPLLRRMASVTAYLEGWGLYTERLADEMGLYSDDVARLGMLALDSMRAGRLVVDTGLHAKGWSRERAVAYLRENTPLALVEIENEVDRYIAAPGQALSYMVGRLEILRLRAFAEQALGAAFDIRDFHDLVLGGGPLPLAVLDEVVTDWVNARLAN